MQPHEILGVEFDADVATIERAYLKQARQAHPDAGGSAEEFRRLSDAYETMTDYCRYGAPFPQSSAAADDGAGRARQADHAPPYDGPSVEDIIKEVKERLDREGVELARDAEPQPQYATGFWPSVVLTPLCAAVVGTCLCFDGLPIEKSVWTFSFAIALTGLCYIASLTALTGASPCKSCLSLYWKVLLAVTLVLVEITRPRPIMRRPKTPRRPLISRHQVPSWWPVPMSDKSRHDSTG